MYYRMDSNKFETDKNTKLRTDEERGYHRLYQGEYYHARTNLNVVCELHGSRSTAKNLVTRSRTPRCQKLSSGRQETFKDGVDKLEQILGKLSAKS